MEILMKLLGYWNRSLPDTIKELEELQQYRRAEQNGLLLRLPCKVGDTVYAIYSDEDSSFIEEPVVVEVSTHRIWIYSGYFNYDDIGKTVFLTKSEAEQALAERKKNENIKNT